MYNIIKYMVAVTYLLLGVNADELSFGEIKSLCLYKVQAKIIIKEENVKGTKVTVSKKNNYHESLTYTKQSKNLTIGGATVPSIKQQPDKVDDLPKITIYIPKGSECNLHISEIMGYISIEKIKSELLDLKLELEGIEAAVKDSEFETLNFSSTAKSTASIQNVKSKTISCIITSCKDILFDDKTEVEDELHIKKSGSGSFNFFGRANKINTEIVAPAGRSKTVLALNDLQDVVLCKPNKRRK